MKITQFHANQAIRLFKPSPALPQDNVKSLDVIREFEARYGFYQAPRVLADYNLQSGMTFLRGQFKKKLIIDKFQLFGNGVLVEAKTSTDDLDEYIDDATNWAREYLALSAEYFVFGERLYLSQFEAEIDLSLESSFPSLVNIGGKINDFLKSYGRNVSGFGVSELRLHPGAGSIEPNTGGAAFIFSRKIGQPLDSHLYFCSAPLRHADHLQVLTDFVSLLQTKKTNAI
jgi:hypothetical protein